MPTATPTPVTVVSCQINGIRGAKQAHPFLPSWSPWRSSQPVSNTTTATVTARSAGTAIRTVKSVPVMARDADGSTDHATGPHPTQVQQRGLKITPVASLFKFMDTFAEPGKIGSAIRSQFSDHPSITAAREAAEHRMAAWNARRAQQVQEEERCGTRALEQEGDRLWGQRDTIRDEITKTPARSPVGRMIRLRMWMTMAVCESIDETLDTVRPHELVVVELVRAHEATDAALLLPLREGPACPSLTFEDVPGAPALCRGFVFP